MIWRGTSRTLETGDQGWKPIDQSPIPLGAGRIWLADNDGNVRRALAWTWGILKSREPRRYRWWMIRGNRAREPSAEAIAALKQLRQAGG